MCPDEQILNEYIDGELESPWKDQIEEHLDWCEGCKKRLETIKSIRKVVQNSVLSDKNIEYSQDRVMRYLNANVLNKEKHTWLQKLHKIVSKKVLLPICSAAVTFCFCLIIFNTGGNKDIISVQETPSVLSIENITAVRSSDSYTTTKSLNDYSLEDIIQHLDKMGYDVTISNKGIVPLDYEEKESSVLVIYPPDIPFTFNYPLKFSFEIP